MPEIEYTEEEKRESEAFFEELFQQIDQDYIDAFLTHPTVQ